MPSEGFGRDDTVTHTHTQGVGGTGWLQTLTGTDERGAEPGLPSED